MKTSVVEQPPEQLRYARWLDAGTRVGLFVSVVGFAVYVLGWMPASVEPQRLSEMWHLPVTQFLQATGAPTGWGWLGQVGHGDMLALLGIALLTACSVPPLLALVPLYRARGDRVYVRLCVAVVAVIALAASGILSAGH
jgi:hypothetical protein